MAKSPFRSRINLESFFAFFGLALILARNRFWFELEDLGWLILVSGVLTILVEIAWAVDDTRNQRR